jgi:hypothetical protein
MAMAGMSLAREAVQPAAPMQLPYTFKDDMNSQWDIQPDGDINDGGNDLYDGGGHLFLSGSVPFQPSNVQGTFAADRNELSIPAMQFNGLNISRRVAVNAHQNWCRFTEVFENPTGQAVKMSIRLNFSIGSPPTVLTPFMDPKHKANVIGMAMGNQANYVAMVGAGRGAKILPRFQGAPGTKDVDMYYDFDVPAKQTVALVHLQVRRTSVDACTSAMNDIKDKEYLAGIDPAVSKCIINFPGGQKYIGDTEVLRGDLSDIVELRSGDQYRGNIKQDRFKLQTAYGNLEVPVDRVIGISSVGLFKPRQLLITTDGEIFGGELAQPSLKLEMSSGQTTDIPLSQITRAGYRKRASEPEEWLLNKPMIYLRTGERMVITTPKDEIAVLTRFGELKLKPETIGSILFQSDDRIDHEIRLTDGSHFTGLVEAPELELTLGPTVGNKIARFPVTAISHIQLSVPKADDESTTDDDDETASLLLSNDDQLTGALSGDLKLDTPFDTITLQSAQISHLAHTDGGSTRDVTVTLWDNTTVSGQLEGSDLTVQLASGGNIAVPAAIVQEYTQPLPQPSAGTIDKIKAAVADLASDDWKQRDRAEAMLKSMGPAVIGVLKEQRPRQSEEAKGRIDAILAELRQARAAAAAPPPSSPVTPDNNAAQNGGGPQNIRLFVPPPQPAVPPNPAPAPANAPQ